MLTKIIYIQHRCPLIPPQAKKKSQIFSCYKAVNNLLNFAKRFLIVLRAVSGFCLGVHSLGPTRLSYGRIVDEGPLLWPGARGAAPPAVAATVTGWFCHCAGQAAERRDQSQQQKEAECDEFHDVLGEAFSVRLIAQLSGARRLYMETAVACGLR